MKAKIHEIHFLFVLTTAACMKEKSGTYYANLMNVCENEKFSHFW
jgi:hypothetical protein